MELKTWVIAGFGLVAMAGVLVRMEKGFGPNNLRAMGIVLVATMSAVLVADKAESMSAAMGILGAIAGYLFGIQTGLPKQSHPTDIAPDPGKKTMDRLWSH